MNKNDLVKEVRYTTGTSEEELEEAVSAIFNEIETALKKGDKVRIKGFGTFEPKKVKGRKCINPKTKEEMVINEHYSPKFKPSVRLKKEIKTINNK